MDHKPFHGHLVKLVKSNTEEPRFIGRLVENVSLKRVSIRLRQPNQSVIVESKGFEWMGIEF